MTSSSIPSKSPQRDSKHQSRIIEEQLLLDRASLLQTYRCFLIGSPESGKSLFMKQLKLIYSGGITSAERLGYRPAVHAFLLRSAQAVVAYMNEFSPYDEKRLVLASTISTFTLPPTGETHKPDQNALLPPEILKAIQELWEDSMFGSVIRRHVSGAGLLDNCDHFFQDIARISKPDYVPSVTDILLVWRKEQSITEFGVPLQIPVEVAKLATQKSTPSRWLRFCKACHTVIFCLALSDYDEVVPDSPNENKLSKSIEMFETIINSTDLRYTGAQVVLLLTKSDIFARKLITVPFNTHFPEYTGGPDPQKAINFVKWKVNAVNQSNTKVTTRVVQLIDRAAVESVMNFVSEEATKLVSTDGLGYA